MLRSLSRRMTGRKSRPTASADDGPMAYSTAPGPTTPEETDRSVPPIPSSPSHLFADSFPTSPSHKALKAAVAAAADDSETNVDIVRRSSSRRKKVGAKTVPVDSQPQPEMMMGLGEMIKSLDIHNLAPGESARFGEVIEAGGYTWLEGDRAAIAVPGVPDVWDPPARVLQLRPSRNKPKLPEMIDYNASRLPSSPLEPLFASLLPSSLDGVDLITDRANLRKLHSLFTSSDPTDFRIDVDYVSGSTVVLSRWEPVERRRQQVMGLSFAPSYSAAVTHAVIPARDPEAGTMRLVKYRFGGLTLLVRFEVDAALPIPSNDSVEVGSSPPNLDVVGSGLPHPPHNSLIDIKLLPSTSALDMSASFAQLVWSRTPSLYIARHARGDCSSPVQKLQLDGPELSAVAEEQDGALRKVAGLLRRIAVLARRNGRVGLVCRDGKFGVYRLEGQSRLSAEAKGVLAQANGRATYPGDTNGSSPTGPLGRSRSLKLGRSRSLKFWAASKTRGMNADEPPMVPQIPA
ncbi:hypothetical protein EHS25_006091 [Saitozyma podzolica]|uniref:Uncharacterized protein n=1 Tax=Saitozyma podzolica TaxID=1890683 RepID=A0A427XTM0_9TREE|nr:hypothetical protein EHS25_006091 [Saitozyma podzolica]